MNLAALRRARGRTQVDLAPLIGTTQSAVSRLERQSDLFVSTLAAYVAATGGRLRLLAVYDDAEHEIALWPSRSPAPQGGRQ